LLIDKKTGKILCIDVGQGKRHDFQLFKISKVRINKSVKLLADSGYQGVKKIHENSKLPKKNSKKKPLTKEEKRANHQISSDRVIIENVIRRVKIFRIMAEKYRNRRKRFTLRLLLITAIINYEL
jgi:hypothetical protein